MMQSQILKNINTICINVPILFVASLLQLILLLHLWMLKVVYYKPCKIMLFLFKTSSSAWRQNDLTGYCFKQRDTPFCLRTDELACFSFFQVLTLSFSGWTCVWICFHWWGKPGVVKRTKPWTAFVCLRLVNCGAFSQWRISLLTQQMMLVRLAYISFW